MAESASLKLIASSQQISQGAEAASPSLSARQRIFKGRLSLGSAPILIKHRFKKKYRHEQLDATLTKARVSGEARTLLKCLKSGIHVPQILMVDASEGVLGIEWIEGQCVRKLLPGGEEPEDGDTYEQQVDLSEDSLKEYGITIGKLMELIGVELAKLHKADIIHGDLTTSNMMLRHPSTFQSPGCPTELVLIDFGLSFVSTLVEDKAVDLYVLERAFASTHPDSEPMFASVLDAYSKALKAKEWKTIKSRLDERLAAPSAAVSSWHLVNNAHSRTALLPLWSRKASTATAAAAAPEEGDAAEAATPEYPTYPLTDADRQRLDFQRNIGVSAHIDSGKTTLTERILFYTGKIREIHEVRGRDSVGAKMDSMDLEREKGITIQSAATFCDWEATDAVDGSKQKYAVNIIDTPGHVDFTIEVERALRVLDGAILVLCAVAGVQSQTTTVDRQMRRYGVPRISFVNKMDRPGANPWRIVNQIRAKLRIPAAAVQVPIGVEDQFRGVVDLVHWRALYNEGYKGSDVVVSQEIPADVLELATQKRQELIEQLAEVDEEIGEIFLNDEVPTNAQIHEAVRRSTIGLKFSPVFLGSAIKNTGVQPLLDGVCEYLPNPSEKEVLAIDTKESAGTAAASAQGTPNVPLVPAASAPLVGLAFKLEEGRYGQLTYMRVYQGTLKKSMQIWNARTGKKIKVPRLVRMHSDEMEDVDSIGPGEICAMFGVECSSGDTFTDGTTSFSMTSMFVPDPVISLSIKPKGQETPNFSRALNRFQKEDPTFKVHIDQESKETIISGMGELHLEIYVERMRREYNVDCITGKPRVAFRETVTQRAEFSFTHKKQTGGAGQYAKVMGFIEPMEVDPETGKDIAFENLVMGGNIPTNFIPAVERGFYEALEKGTLSGNPITGVRFVLKDGAFHAVDSSELAFRLAAIGAFREAFKQAAAIMLEPVMTVEVVAPSEFQSQVIGGLNTRRGTIVDSEVRDDEFTAVAEVALNDMFGYSNQLRGSTQGKGEFSMEYKHHMPVLPNVQKELEEAYKKTLNQGKK